MTQRHKNLNKVLENYSFECSKTFFDNLELNEIKKYASILKTPLWSTGWQIDNRCACKKEIIEDALVVMFGEF